MTNSPNSSVRNSCSLLITFQIYSEIVYFLVCCRSGSIKSHQNLIRISAQMFLMILTTTKKDLYFTEHYPVEVYLHVHTFVDAENVLLWKFSASGKFSLHIVYIFKLTWNLSTKFWHSDQRLDRNIFTSVLYRELDVLATLRVGVLEVLASLRASRGRVFSVLAGSHAYVLASFTCLLVLCLY